VSRRTIEWCLLPGATVYFSEFLAGTVLDHADVTPELFTGLGRNVVELTYARAEPTRVREASFGSLGDVACQVQSGSGDWKTDFDEARAASGPTGSTCTRSTGPTRRWSWKRH
jgi:hypothetical protein